MLMCFLVILLQGSETFGSLWAAVNQHSPLQMVVITSAAWQRPVELN